MITNVCFKVVKFGDVCEEIIPIEHNFEIIKGEVFNGYRLPDQSIESQVIDYLDSIDKRDIMIKHNFDIILDYYIKKEKTIDDEISEFIEFLSKYISIKNNRQIRALLYEGKDFIFGKNKSIEEKVNDLILLMNIYNKSIDGTLNFIINNIKKENKKLS